MLTTHRADELGNVTSAAATSDPYAGYGAQSGYYRDETGLYLLGHRYYDPSNGRFLTRDPTGIAGGLNLYGYCSGQAVGGMDPSGLDQTGCQDVADWIEGWQHRIDGATFDTFRNDGDAGVAMATYFSTTTDFTFGAVTGILRMGTGLGRYAGNPCEDNLPGAVIDGCSMALFVLGGVEGGALEEGAMLDESPPAPEPSVGPESADPAPESEGVPDEAEGNCFSAGTEVASPWSAPQTIESVAPGSSVLSRDQYSQFDGGCAPAQVEYTQCHLAFDADRLLFVNGSTLTVTEGHPLYVAGRGFTAVRDVRPGDALMDRDGRTLRLIAKEPVPYGVQVYNFSVAGSHTYFVKAGDFWLWAHNDCGKPEHQVTVNRRSGLNKEAEALREREITPNKGKGSGIKTPLGYRYPDGYTIGPDGVRTYYEIKSGSSTYGGSQMFKDQYLASKTSYRIQVIRVP